MLNSRLPLDALDWTLWCLQVIVLVLAWRSSRNPRTEAGSLTWERCAIAILVAWSWRLVYAFVLASGGFRYLVPDDVARWLLSWGWSESPYALTWDGIWQAGTFYLHGTAMAFLGDPLAASKFVSAFYNLLPLAGIFVLAQGLYRSTRLSSVAVLAAAPFWLHILLGSGAMTEMPVTGLMLAGVGLLLLAVDPGTGERAAGRALIGAGFCFLAATAFHIVAWMMLAGFLLAFGRRLLSNAALRRRLPLFLALSVAYCVFWSLACWIRFGSPLAFLTNYDANNVKHGLYLPLSSRARAFPLAFLYDAWLTLPAIGAGVIAAFANGGERQRRERLVIGGVGATMAVLIASAIVGSSPSALPVRNSVAIVTALFPISVAAVARAWPAGEALRSSRTRRISAVALIALGVAWVAVNHERTFQRVRSQQTLDPDAVAMGAWLRESYERPDETSSGGNTPIVHVWVTTTSAFPDYSIAYLFGSPARTRIHAAAEPMPTVLSSIARGDQLVTDRSETFPGFEPVVTVGKYRLLRARG